MKADATARLGFYSNYVSVEHEKRILILQAMSAGRDAGNLACISMNDVPIKCKENENGHHRGLHIVVINSSNGKVVTAKVFDTYKTSASFNDFIAKEITTGFIVVAACKDDCITNLSTEGKAWFTKMGSREISNLAYRCGFAFIGMSGQQFANERRAKAPGEQVAVTYILQVNESPAIEGEKEYLENLVKTKRARDIAKREAGMEEDLEFREIKSGNHNGRQYYVAEDEDDVEKSIDYYLLGDEFVEIKDRMTMLVEWCQKEGLIMPKLKYPAYFAGGVIGIKCSEDIQHHEVYMAIPYKMIFSTDKVQQHQVLAPVIMRYPNCFDKDTTQEWQHLSLTLGILYEISLGKEGYWYPWIRQMLDVETRYSWDDKELEMVQDLSCIYEII